MPASKQQIFSLLYHHPDYFISAISQFYPFSEAELDKYADLIDWDKINQNAAIPWTRKLIKKFDHRLDWYQFSQNAVFANTDLLEACKDRIDWKGVVEDGMGFSVASSSYIIWTSDLIKKYEDLLNFNYLSMSEKAQWSEQLIDRYLDRWDWGNMMMNFSIPWTFEMFERFLPYMDQTLFWFEANPVFTANIRIVEKYQHLFDMHAICRNPDLPWKELDLLTRWKDKIDWNGIAGNRTLMSDPQFFEANLHRWINNQDIFYYTFSHNEGLPWAVDFLERFENRWNWESLSSSSFLPWNKKLIDRYIDLWEWGGTRMFDITQDADGNNLPEPYEQHELYSQGLVTNESLPWSLDFISDYEDRLDFKILAGNEKVWENVFKPYVDDKLVETIVRLI